MLNNYFTQLNNISMAKRTDVVQHLRMYKYATGEAAEQVDGGSGGRSAEEQEKGMKELRAQSALTAGRTLKDVAQAKAKTVAAAATEKRRQAILDKDFARITAQQDAAKATRVNREAAAQAKLVTPSAPGTDISKMFPAFGVGKDYAAPVGYGAAGGALAGIPIALLANALFGKDKGLRGSLRAALMGGLVGGGAGAMGGAGVNYLHNNYYAPGGGIQNL